jgi:WhiB family redox-sensing transcriptional regulator
VLETIAGIRPEDRSWRAQAACRGVDPAFFFPPTEDRTGPGAAPGTIQTHRRAVEFCSGCPVLTDCRSWVLNAREVPRHGVVAGLTPEERAVLRAERGVLVWTGSQVVNAALKERDRTWAVLEAHGLRAAAEGR